MTSFYENWLRLSTENEQALADSPAVARGKELPWVETEQDWRVQVLIGSATGFATQGTVLLKAEIPSGSHTGRHLHGEEAIYILSGTGFIVIDKARYDFAEGTVIHVPYMAEHELINTGTDPVIYLSALNSDLDLFVRLGRFKQLSPKGNKPDSLVSGHPTETSQFALDGRRITLHPHQRISKHDARDSDERSQSQHSGHTHGKIWLLMGGKETADEETNGFRARAAAMTHVFEEVPHSASHKHTHTEAMLYVLEGVGYSVVDDERHDWEAGDAVHIPPKMTTHEHFNESEGRTRTLRIEFGIRFFYEALWTGYDKVAIRDETVTLR